MLDRTLTTPIKYVDYKFAQELKCISKLMKPI